MTMKTTTTYLFAAALVLATGPVWADEIRETREASADGRIEFAAVTGDLEVIGHDAEEFILEGRLGDDVEELIIEGDASNWHIELKPVEGRNDWDANDRSSDLTLYVPRGSDLELGSVSGDIRASELSGPALEIETVSGDVDLDNIESSEIEIQTVSGDVTAENVTGEQSEYQSVSGDFEISGASGRLDIESVSGRVTVEADAVSDFESETVSGALEARLSPTAGASLKVSSHSGALELHLRVDDTPRIRAETYSGRIESDFGEVEEAGFGSGESLRVDGGSDAVDIEAESFSGRVTIRRID
jgi:DUF4097 and DUF4098 domain-containing protein YvlB